MPVGEQIAVGRLERGQTDKAAALLARAFVNEPFFAYLLGSTPARRERALRPYLASAVAAFLPFGEVHRASTSACLRLSMAAYRVGIRSQCTVATRRWPAQT